MNSTHEENLLTLTTSERTVSESAEAHVLSVLDGIDAPRKLFPLVCVTFKMTLNQKKRMQKLCEQWELNCSEMIRRQMEAMLDVIECPTEPVRALLVANREAVIARRKALESHRLAVTGRRERRRGLAASAEQGNH